MALSITELKKGTIFQLAGVPYRVVSYNQKVMGRGGSIVNVRVKSLVDGRVLDKTFRGNEQLEPADISTRDVQYLYSDESYLHFMDGGTYEQLNLPVAALASEKRFLKDGDTVSAQFSGSQLVSIELPKNIPLKVTYTESAVRGDTSSAITKDATLETGLVIKVPAFVKTDDIVSVDTTNGEYRERVR